MKSLYIIKNIKAVRKHTINEALTLYQYEGDDYIPYEYLKHLNVRMVLLRVLIEDLGCLKLLEDEHEKVVLIPLDDVLIIQSDIVYEAFTISDEYVAIKEKRIDAQALAKLAGIKELCVQYFK